MCGRRSFLFEKLGARRPCACGPQGLGRLGSVLDELSGPGRLRRPIDWRKTCHSRVLVCLGIWIFASTEDVGICAQRLPILSASNGEVLSALQWRREWRQSELDARTIVWAASTEGAFTRLCVWEIPCIEGVRGTAPVGRLGVTTLAGQSEGWAPSSPRAPVAAPRPYPPTDPGRLHQSTPRTPYPHPGLPGGKILPEHHRLSP